MPRKPKTATTLDVPADRAAQLPVFVTAAPPPTTPAATVIEERRDRELDELIEAIGTDGRLTVWHIIDGKATYAGNMSLDGFSLQAVLESFGGGDKSLVFYQGKQKVDTFRVSLDPSVPPTSPTKAKVAPATSTAPANTPLSDLSGFIAAMANAQLANMQTMSNIQQASSQNMQTMLAALTTAMTSQPRTDPIALVSAILAALKDNKPSGESAPTKELLDMFERGLSISERLGGGDGDDVTSIVSKGVSTLGVLIEGIVAEKKANAARITAGAAGPGGGSGSVGTDARGFVGDGTDHIGTSGGDDGAGDVSRITHTGATTDVASPIGEHQPVAQTTARPTWAPEGFSNLTVQAFNWLTPDEAAALIANRLTDDQFDALLTDIETPGFGERLIRYYPAAASVDPEWIGQLITQLLTDDGADDDGATGTP